MASGAPDSTKPSASNTTPKPGSSSVSQQIPANGSAQTSNREAAGPTKSKRRNRGGKKNKRNRRQSFFAPSEATETAADDDDRPERPSLLDVPNPRSSAQQASLYRLRNANRSNTSLESEALLDHRGHDAPRSRRKSVSQPHARSSIQVQRSKQWEAHGTIQSPAGAQSRLSRTLNANTIDHGDEDDVDATDRTPLLGLPHSNRSRPDLSRNNSTHNYGSYKTRRSSAHSKDSRIRPGSHRNDKNDDDDDDYDVNNPPSVPGSPQLGSLDDLMITDLSRSDPTRDHDALIDIDRVDNEDDGWNLPSASPDMLRRRATVAELAERDVCFPLDDALTEIDELEEPISRASSRHIRRRRSRRWPDLDILEEWSREEKEERTAQEVLRVKKISEPLVVGGRLRPKKAIWHPEEDDAPFRFTYFNENLDSTIHARTISDLCQDGATFKDLFLPDPIELSDDSDSDEAADDFDDEENVFDRPLRHRSIQREGSVAPSETNTLPRNTQRLRESTGALHKSPTDSRAATGTSTPEPRDLLANNKPKSRIKRKRYGPRPTFWLDVLKPTDIEMKVISKAFGIHQLTTEDILTNEEREKVELFQSYYFVNYRSFEQDKDNSEYMEPVNIYVVVFREGVISFHHSQTPHPANVRRRIRQLNDYMSPTADWISYAVIDDITDSFAPLVKSIEEEVDDIDDEILYMHQSSADAAVPAPRPKPNQISGKTQADAGATKAEGEKTLGEQGGDMLRRVGECRKSVMSLYRLLGNKADVIKGFAKRCNEHWEVAPRSEIGLYLGDIQDHIVTMTSNLSHYENLLSRAHSNYLAQINIRMNERAEQTADVLGKLTVLGTIVLPMNIVTGMWGMNVWVPGQGKEGELTWFWCITAGLVAFGLTCYFVAKRVYRIV